jgi:hypothetical protein
MVNVIKLPVILESPFMDDLPEKLVEEWNNSDGSVNCEFSTSGENLDKKMLYLNQLDKGIKKGYWEVFVCNTCYMHHGGIAYFHCQIVKDSY